MICYARDAALFQTQCSRFDTTINTRDSVDTFSVLGSGSTPDGWDVVPYPTAGYFVVVVAQDDAATVGLYNEYGQLLDTFDVTDGHCCSFSEVRLSIVNG